MSIRKISSDSIFIKSGQILANHTIVINQNQIIIDIIPSASIDEKEREHYSGWLIPGFINTHCHLELSHLKGQLPTGTGLIPFITGVVTGRAAQAEVIQDACLAADQAMWEAGIMAVGDISNTTDSFAAKMRSRLDYYTFIEAFDLMQPQDANKSFSQAKEVFDNAPGIHSLVPHAPYTCTPEIIRLINEVNKNNYSTISIHNQETVHENNFFLNKTGELIDFYTSIGLDLNAFHATNKSSIHHLLDHCDLSHPYLFVHNTLSTVAEYEAAVDKISSVYWATCANANLYIENRLPDYKMFADLGAKMTIGTDSLASNWQLSVWDEIVTIKKYNSFLSNETLLTWAGINGAEALQLQDKLGSIEVGKAPGLLHINTSEGIEDIIQPHLRPVRIV